MEPSCPSVTRYLKNVLSDRLEILHMLIMYKVRIQVRRWARSVKWGSKIPPLLFCQKLVWQCQTSFFQNCHRRRKFMFTSKNELWLGLSEVAVDIFYILTRGERCTGRKWVGRKMYGEKLRGRKWVGRNWGGEKVVQSCVMIFVYTSDDLRPLAPAH